MNLVTKEYSQRIRDCDTTIWIVELDNGETIYQDEYEGEKSAWLRLKQYCEENKLKIVDMRLQFRSHVEQVGKGYDGYFFRTAAGRWVSETKSKRPTNIYFLAGFLKNGTIYIKKWKTPELVVEYTEERDADSELAIESLILNKDKK